MTTLGFCDLIEYRRGHNAIATIAAHDRKTRIDFGVIQTNHDYEVVGNIEKPTYDFYVSMGVYVFEPRVLSYIPHYKYLDFPDLVLKMIAADERVLSYPYEGYWMDLGRISDYEHAVTEFDRLCPQLLGEHFDPTGTHLEHEPLVDHV